MRQNGDTHLSRWIKRSGAGLTQKDPLTKTVNFRANRFFYGKKLTDGFEHLSYSRPDLNSEQLSENARTFYHEMNLRRTVREFDTRPVPVEVIENIIRAAGTAPSGAHNQPWTFCLIHDPEIKRKIRVAAEEE